jgi:hypothetical protein
MPLIGGLCLTAGFNQMWFKMCPSSEDFFMQRTSTKCGQKCAPHWRTLSCSGFWPNVAQNVPLIGGLCYRVDLTKYGLKCAPCWKTLSCSRLWPNVAQNLPLVGGLCHTADFNQMRSEMCPSSEDFVMQRTSTKCGPNLCLLTGDCILLQGLITYGSTMYSSSRRPVPNKRILIVNQCRTKTTVSNYKYHVINMLKSIRANKLWQRNDGYCIHYATNDKWHGLHTTITNAASYSMK